MKRKIVVIFMKVDLVDENTVNFWEKYFIEIFPLLKIVKFSIYSSTEKKKRYVSSCGVFELLKALSSYDIKKNGEIVSWESVFSKYTKDASLFSETPHEVVEESDRTQSQKFLTIGLVGHPNVGKSSLINGIVGKKVVSSSRSPGHTKHFQTIHLSPVIRLCDCPGLVFPSLVPKSLQVIIF
jgi:ribosome biogenesis GTPase A